MWWLYGAQAGAAILGGMMGADAAEEQAKQQAQAAIYEGTLENELKKQEALDVLKQSQAEADKIKAAARSVRSSQVAQAAASGVVVGEGSAQAMQDRTTELSEQDALAMLYSGANRASALRTAGSFALTTAQRRASAAISQGESQATAAWMGAAGSLLSIGGKAYDKGLLKIPGLSN